MSETGYRKRLLHALLDKYELSNQYQQPELRRAILLEINEADFKEYYDEANPSSRDQINYDAEMLEKEGICRIRWNRPPRNHEIYKIELTREKTQIIYEELGRIPLHIICQRFGSIIDSFIASSEITWWGDFLKNEKQILLTPKLKTNYLKASMPDEGKLLLAACEKIIKNNTSQTWRKFCVKNFGNSKALDHLLPRIASILTENDPELKEYDLKDTSDVLREYQLLRSPQKILFNGNLTMVNPKGEQSINMGIFQPFIGVSSQTALEWEIKEIGFDKIITIENEASFYEFCQMNQDMPGLGNYLVVFLKGFSNRLRRQFLRKVNTFAKQAHKAVSFFHWGDLDAGGIEIFLNLRQSTGINIRPFLFNAEVIEYHERSCKPLEKSDSVRLSRIRERLYNFDLEDYKTLESLINKMLELNLKLEQEAIDIQNWIESSNAKSSSLTNNPRIDA